MNIPDAEKKHSYRTVAVVLSGGRGNRMKSNIPKQYLEIDGKPILYYALKAFEDSFIDEIILVTGEGDQEYCKATIVDRYGFKKISKIVAGGKERFNSVYSGISAIENAINREADRAVGTSTDTDGEPEKTYVFIHDGARPCVSSEILKRCLDMVMHTGACVAAMPVKDTIKIVNEEGNAVSTPDRKLLWQIQTPQVFDYEIISTAYKKLIESKDTDAVTDDAMVVEKFGTVPVRMVEGSYSNIKVTTPDDLEILRVLLK